MELIILIWGFWIVPSNVPKCPTTKQYGSTPALIPDKEWPDYTLFGTGKSLYTRPPNTVTLFLLSSSTVSPLFRVLISSTGSKTIKITVLSTSARILHFGYGTQMGIVLADLLYHLIQSSYYQQEIVQVVFQLDSLLLQTILWKVENHLRVPLYFLQL